jgi:predicted enzyme related to lactoylglutathione lyase
MSDQKAPHWHVAPNLIVRDVAAAADYYRDQLGFSYERLWGDPPRFTIVWRNYAHIMLRQMDGEGAVRPNRIPDPEGNAWDIYLWIEDADALYAEYEAKGVKIIRMPCDQFYGCRDFEIEDLNGYRLCFGQNLGE